MTSDGLVKLVPMHVLVFASVGMSVESSVFASVLVEVNIFTSISVYCFCAIICVCVCACMKLSVCTFKPV